MLTSRAFPDDRLGPFCLAEPYGDACAPADAIMPDTVAEAALVPPKSTTTGTGQLDA
ncbi:hypothetical protein [Streptomyces sp. WAC 01420]|uniref:hypothetical protein n=1 Tax=Streptomyces sp. WAC 01420 TaxID=2203203 RepID=UPI0026B3D3B1